MVTGNSKIGGRRGRLSRPSLAQSRFGSSVRTEQMNAAGAIGRKKIHAGERMAEVLRARPSVRLPLEQPRCHASHAEAGLPQLRLTG